MRKYKFIFLVLVLIVGLAGCSKKKEVILPETPQPISMEELAKQQVAQTTVPLTETELEPLPPSGPYKPTAQEIQTALKNAGYYTGIIDGKIGPMTKKATEEFQKANGLEVDGKVGPKTWAVLSKYLIPQTTTSSAGKSRQP